jgi:hypothetical protein
MFFQQEGNGWLEHFDVERWETHRTMSIPCFRPKKHSSLPPKNLHHITPETQQILAFKTSRDVLKAT